jgi:hypothetical protein
MNSTNRKDWNRNSRNDTVTNVGVIVVGVLAIIVAALADVNEGFASGSQIAYQQNTGVRVAATATRV